MARSLGALIGLVVVVVVSRWWSCRSPWLTAFAVGFVVVTVSLAARVSAAVEAQAFGHARHFLAALRLRRK